MLIKDTQFMVRYLQELKKNYYPTCYSSSTYAKISRNLQKLAEMGIKAELKCTKYNEFFQNYSILRYLCLCLEL
jgi:hypothetical protein